jgi:hypothetical protein
MATGQTGVFIGVIAGPEEGGPAAFADSLSRSHLDVAPEPYSAGFASDGFRGGCDCNDVP